MLLPLACTPLVGDYCFVMQTRQVTTIARVFACQQLCGAAFPGGDQIEARRAQMTRLQNRVSSTLCDTIQHEQILIYCSITSRRRYEPSLPSEGAPVLDPTGVAVYPMAKALANVFFRRFSKEGPKKRVARGSGGSGLNVFVCDQDMSVPVEDVIGDPNEVLGSTPRSCDGCNGCTIWTIEYGPVARRSTTCPPNRRVGSQSNYQDITDLDWNIPRGFFSPYLAVCAFNGCVTTTVIHTAV